MTAALRLGRQWTADEFIATAQHIFGDAWRYELVDGRIVAHAAPAPDHGAIIAGIVAGLACRAGAVPRLGAPRPREPSSATPPASRT